jgi:uncharacterized protein (TIGR00299 family) protein
MDRHRTAIRTNDFMGRHLHFDCFSGISGDMVLGALVSAGLPWTDLVGGLKGLKLGGYRLRRRDVRRGALHAVKVDVMIRHGFEEPLSLSRIRRILAASTLPDSVKQRSRDVFDRLAHAEGLAHRASSKDVHFHEVGVVDSFIDVVGSILGCHLLHVTRVTASAINVGAGMIQTSHGLLPVPGPAVAALAKGIPVYSDGPRCELATPTGVALLRTLTEEFGPATVLESSRVGYGAGDQDPQGWPNALRVFLSDDSGPAARLTDRVMQIETNLDDLTPQAYEHVMDRLFSVGALDVALIPVIMKRSRPGVIVSCLAPHDQADVVMDILLQETTALGVRIQELSRQILSRRFVTVKVHHHPIRMKVADVGTGRERATPEYSDCRTIANRTGRPLKDVMEEAVLVYRRAQGKRNASA